MATARYELRWGYGFEHQNRRDQARPVLHYASELASIGLRFLKIEVPPKPKSIVAVRTKKPFVAKGYSTTEDTMYVYLRPQNINSSRPSVYGIAATILHETVHCMRREVADPDSLLERSATEGLAYSAEYFFNQTFRPNRRKPSSVDKVMDLPAEKIEELKADFIAAGSLPDSWTDDSFRQWIGTGRSMAAAQSTLKVFSVGEIVGIRSVMNHIETGRGINELITLPAAELLGAN